MDMTGSSPRPRGSRPAPCPTRRPSPWPPALRRHPLRSPGTGPWFRYVDGQGREHEVWFEDARSIRAKLALAAELELYGVGYWNLMRPFPQNWAVLNSLYEIRAGD